MRRSRWIAIVALGAIAQAAGAQETSSPAPAVPSPLATQTPPPPAAGPIAIVPIDAAHPDRAAKVTGALEVADGRAIIQSNGEIVAGTETTPVTLPRRGTLRVCASSTVRLASDPSVGAGETPGLMMSLDHGAMEASFATGRNSDILLTPDFRILISGPGAVEVKVRLGEHGDTCVDNPGTDAPYVLVSSVFEGGVYRVQPGQRVMFQHGSLHEVVDNEKEPCGCPPAAPAVAQTNEFPLAQSQGLAPLPKSAPVPPAAASSAAAHEAPPLVYNPAGPAVQPAPFPEPAPQPALPQLVVASPQPAPAAPNSGKKPGFFHRLGRFFRRLFGAE